MRRAMPLVVLALVAAGCATQTGDPTPQTKPSDPGPAERSSYAMSLTSASAVGSDAGGDVHWKRYRVSSASPRMPYAAIGLTVGGLDFAFDANGCALAPPPGEPRFGACRNEAGRAATENVTAGDVLTIACHAPDGDCLSDRDLVVTDWEKNSVMLVLRIG